MIAKNLINIKRTAFSNKCNQTFSFNQIHSERKSNTILDATKLETKKK